MARNKLVAILFLSVCGCGVAFAGRVQSPPSTVTGACHVSPIVSDLDKSARFYRDVIGLDLVPASSPGHLPWDADPGHLKYATLAALKKGASSVISSGGVPVQMTFGSNPWRLVVAQDPNNLFLVVQQRLVASNR